MQTQADPLLTTPRADGFRMPGEFEPHAGCWMLWPFRPDVWRDAARPAQAAFVAVATAISRFEPVTIGVIPQQLAQAHALLPPTIDIVELSYNDAWMRDNGPTFVVNAAGETRGVDWDFNAWGGLYHDWMEDDALARKVLALRGFGRYKCPLVMEGGAIDVDGEGTLIVTEQSLLDPRRNPGRSRGEVEALLRDYLNVEKVIWLREGVYNDETAGHIDNLCCFVRPTVVALTWTDDQDDPQYPISRAAYEQLSSATDARGRPLSVVKLHQPTPMVTTAEDAGGLVQRPGSWPRPAGQRLATSYINYYVANGGVVVPQFGDAHDGPALETIQALYPERAVVGVYTREIALGGGNIHCVTQQQPG